MAKDKGQVRRVLQILSPEDQETLAILHDPPRMEELLRRHETLAEIESAGMVTAREGLPIDTDASEPAVSGLHAFPTALDELAGLPHMVRETLLRDHLPGLVAAPQEGLALTQLFQGMWLTICPIEGIDYRVVYRIDTEAAGITLLMIGTWESLEQRLAEG